MAQYYKGKTRKPSSKYHATKAKTDGIVFDSKREAERYKELRILEKAGKISDLKRQVKYILIPAQREPDIVGPKGGVKPGRLLEHEWSYYADFVYNVDGYTVVEDVKGMRTPEYISKRKAMLWFHGIRIKEV